MDRFSKQEIADRINVVNCLTKQLFESVSGQPPVYHGPIDARHDLQGLVTEIGGFGSLPQELKKQVKRVLYAQEGGFNSLCKKPEVRQRGPFSPDYNLPKLELTRLAKK